MLVNIAKVNKLPDNIPANPDTVYKKQWNMEKLIGDFLGTELQERGMVDL